MLKVRLLTIEDNKPREIYQQTFDEVIKWMFIEKNLVQLDNPQGEECAWVTNLEDWQSAIGSLVAGYDLVFCTVDLKIPKNATEDLPQARNGFAILREIQSKYRHKVRCCVLTGVAESDLEEYMAKSESGHFEVPFEFKDDESNGVPGLATHIKSQVLANMKTLEFEDFEGRQHMVLLEESSGIIKDYFLSRAPYFIEPAGWHIPTIFIGDSGLGVGSFVAFVAFLADAVVETIALQPEDAEANHRHYRQLCLLRDELAVPRQESCTKKILYVTGLAGYQPHRMGWHDANCFTPLRDIINLLSESDRCRGQGLSLVFRIYAESRFHIKDRATREFLRWLEEQLDHMTGVPLQYLGIDAHGWPVGHPHILRFPSLAQRGPQFLPRVAKTFLTHWSRARSEDLGGKSAVLSTEMNDFLLEKTHWATQGNLAGLVSVLRAGFQNFIAQRAAHQIEITKNHLPQAFRERFEQVILNVDDVSLSYPTRDGGTIDVIEFADFSVNQGEVLVILGPSGCGKSSILKLLSGLAQPLKGQVSYRGNVIEGPSSKIGMVFQDYSLFPWLTVQQNVAFGPKNRGEPRDELNARVNQLLEVSNLTDFRHAYPNQLSGGMRQRVAIVRTLANEPDVLLMDEPFGALDLQTRWHMQEFLLKTRHLTQTTVVFVTHDIDEAVFVADRIYVASPRPLTLGDCFHIPFSLESRVVSLRHDPHFVDWVDRVRASILAAAEQKF